VAGAVFGVAVSCLCRGAAAWLFSWYRGALSTNGRNTGSSFYFRAVPAHPKTASHRSHSCRDAKQRRWIGGNSALVSVLFPLRYAATAFAKPAASFIDWLSVFPAQLRSGARESRSGTFADPSITAASNAKSETRTRARCCSSTALVFANCARSSKRHHTILSCEGCAITSAFTTRSILPAHRRFGGTVV